MNFQPNLFTAAKSKVVVIREHHTVAQSRQKSYADKQRSLLLINVGDYVYLRERTSMFRG